MASFFALVLPRRNIAGGAIVVGACTRKSEVFRKLTTLCLRRFEAITAMERTPSVPVFVAKFCAPQTV
jgi:hypothetical protein